MRLSVDLLVSSCVDMSYKFLFVAHNYIIFRGVPLKNVPSDDNNVNDNSGVEEFSLFVPHPLWSLNMGCKNLPDL